MLLVKRYLGWVAMSPNGPKLRKLQAVSVAAFGGQNCGAALWPVRLSLTQTV